MFAIVLIMSNTGPSTYLDTRAQVRFRDDSVWYHPIQSNAIFLLHVDFHFLLEIRISQF